MMIWLRKILAALRSDNTAWKDFYPLRPKISAQTGLPIDGPTMRRRVDGVYQYRACTADEEIDQFVGRHW